MPHAPSGLPKRLRTIGRRRFLGSVRTLCLRLYPDIFPSLKSVSKSLISLFLQSWHPAVNCTPGLMFGNPPSLELWVRREATTSPGIRTCVRPTASRRVSGREAVNTGCDEELRLLCQPHGFRCELSHYLCRPMLLSTIKSTHTHIEAYMHMSEKRKWENSSICNGCLKWLGSTERWWIYTDRGNI